MCRNSHGEIPNITGNLVFSIAFGDGNGTFRGLGVESGGYAHAYRDKQHGWYYGLDASRSSNNYGAYGEVRPKYECAKFYMKF